MMPCKVVAVVMVVMVAVVMVAVVVVAGGGLGSCAGKARTELPVCLNSANTDFRVHAVFMLDACFEGSATSGVFGSWDPPPESLQAL